MYISYIDKKTGKIETTYTTVVTDKNQYELDKKIPSFNYLYEEALKILSLGNLSGHYRTEYRHKKNGCKRRIDVPDDILMNYQDTVVNIFTNNLNFLFPKCVFGYVKGRNPKGLAEVHKNQYQVITVDIKDFFPSCTLDFIMKSFSAVYPFCLLDEELLETIIMPCMVFYDGKYRLPQGAPTSPLLSNIAMIPIDYSLEHCKLHNRFPQYNYKYTRFADDIIISHDDFIFTSAKTEMDALLSSIFGTKDDDEEMSIEEKNRIIKSIIKEVLNAIENCLKSHNPDFQINRKKTKIRYFNHGNVRMLGLTIGDDIKIGNKNKQHLKATLWSFLMDCKKNQPWSKNRTRKMLGLLGYAKYIEPKFVTNYVTRYEGKSEMNFRDEVKKIMC